MRNVLVVLVLSCIGLSCGFVVPSGIREIVADLIKSANTIEISKSKPRNMIKSKTLDNNFVNRTSELSTNSIKIHHNSSNNSLDNDLYENSNEKDATIEERAFIYIKQRAKKPYLKNVFELIPKINTNYKAIKPYVLSHAILDDISKNFITENVENKFFNTDVGESNQNKYQSKINNFINYYIEEERKHQFDKNFNKQGKQLDIIKAPLARPILKTNEKDFISMEDSLFNFTIGRKLLADIQESLLGKNAIKSKNDGHLENKPTDINYMRRVTVNDESFDSDNLDQIVKTVMGNQILESNSNQIDDNGYNFCRDCFNKGKEQISNSRQQAEPICKCGLKRLIKNREDAIVN